LIYLSDLNSGETLAVSVVIGIMVVFGLVMWFAGKRIAWKNAMQEPSPRPLFQRERGE